MTHADATPGVSPTPVVGRDRFLDTIRTIALARVILWHAFGAAVLTYVIAAVPTMFFVTGSLLAKSLDRRPWPTVVMTRARRVLVPLWFFGAASFVAMSVAWQIDPSPRTVVPWRSIVFWIVPLGDPQGSAWEGGWLSQPLWYIRAMFWLLLLGPLLRRAQRRVGLRLVAAPFVALLALEILQRRGVVLDAAPELLWQVGDLALYSIFLLAGFAHRDGAFDRLAIADWIWSAAAAGALAAGWIATQSVPLGVVNNSHPAHLLVGTTWLCLFFAARVPLTRLGETRPVRASVEAISRRTMTIYLWHAAAIIITLQLLDRYPSLPTPVYVAAMLLGVAATTTTFVFVAGWVEDVAARRRIGRVPRLAGVVAGVVVLALAATTARALPIGDVSASAALRGETVGKNRRPPIPSQAPPRPTFPSNPSSSASPTTVARSVEERRFDVATPEVDPATAATLQRELDEWRQRWRVPGLNVGVLLPGGGFWYGASGVDDETSRPTQPDDRFDIDSVTKTFTGAMVFQLASEGRIDLDAPVPALDRVPAFPHDAGITVRHLLEHRSGIVPYRDVGSFATDAAVVADPAAVLDRALRVPLAFAPGTQSQYSSTNYLVLGFLLEQVTGQSFDELLRSRLLEPLGLDAMTHTAPAALAPNFAASGIVTTAADLLRWAVALYRDGRVVDANALAEMQRIDPTSGLGPAVFGYCPCTLDDQGMAHWRWIGHSGGTTQLAYSDADDVAVVINVTDTLWSAGRGEAIAELQEILRARIVEFAPPHPSWREDETAAESPADPAEVAAAEDEAIEAAPPDDTPTLGDEPGPGVAASPEAHASA